MIRRILASAGVFLATAGFSLSGALAGVGGTVGAVEIGQHGSHVIKVHSAGKVGDELNRKGYYKVRYIGQFYGRDDRPVYKFKGCRRGVKYKLLVNWYGDIIKRRDIGDCHYRHKRYDDHYGKYDGHRRYKHRKYGDEGSSYHRGYKD